MKKEQRTKPNKPNRRQKRAVKAKVLRKRIDALKSMAVNPHPFADISAL